MQRLGAVLFFLVTLSIQSCGGGGGSSPPPAPSVTISGNEGTYWQDDAVNIRFTTSNMDTSSVSYAVTGSLGENNFEVDSEAGTFKDVADDFIEAGKYSLTVTATDSGGKTASRSFQFTVDLVATGALQVCDPSFGCGNSIREILFFTTRDGKVGISGLSLDLSQYQGFDGVNYYGAFGFRQLTCFGNAAIDGIILQGSASCGGYLPVVDGSDPEFATDFIEISRVDFEVDSAGQGNLEFYNEAGELVDTWLDASNQELENYDGWPTNSDISGQYVAVSVSYQYLHFVDAFLYQVTQDLNPLARSTMVTPLVNLIIDSSHQMQGGFTADGVTACSISGSLTPIALSEYDSVHSSRGSPWRAQYRVMSADITANGCDQSVFFSLEEAVTGLEPTYNMNQSSPDAYIVASRGFNTIFARNTYADFLLVGGGGDGNPFETNFLKICDANGLPEPVNQDLSYGECQTP